MNPENELLSCPFCKSIEIDPAFWASHKDHGPGCDKCGATALNNEAWNTRAVPVTPDELARLVEIAHEGIPDEWYMGREDELAFIQQIKSRLENK